MIQSSMYQCICVTIEGFVLYAGGDYGLHLNIMLLVQVMAYVMSGTFAIDIVGHWTCALESGPLIGAPVAHIAGGWDLCGRLESQSSVYVAL